MSIVMRNTWTGEITEVEENSADFEEKRLARRHTDDKPLWEQTSRPDAVEQETRLEDGRGQTTDVPDGGQPVDRIGLTPDTTNTKFGPDLKEPTPGEVSAEAGRAASNGETPTDISASSITTEQVREAVEGESLATERGKVFDGANPSAEDFEVGKTGLGDSEPKDEDEDPYKGLTKDELIDQFEKRNSELDEEDQVELKGTGSGGNVVVGDVRAALEELDSKDAGDESEEESS